MEQQQIPTADAAHETPGKTVISISRPTPAWATWVFRAVYWMVFGIGVWLAATNVVSDKHKFEILLALSALDRFIWGMARGLGVKKEDFADGAAQ